MIPKQTRTLIVAMVCILLLVQPVVGANGENETPLSESAENTDIVVLKHFIGLDLSKKDHITVHESIVFAKDTQMNYTGYLSIWVPGDANIIEISRKEMSESGQTVLIQHNHEANLLLINDTERFNAQGMPPIYSLKYTVPITEEEEDQFVKVLRTESHDYPISSLIIEVNSAEGMVTVVTDEKGNEIKEEAIEPGNRFAYTLSNPQIKEIRIKAEPENKRIKTSYLLIIPPILIAIYLLLNKSKRTGNKKEELKEMKIRHAAILAVMKDMKRDLEKGVTSREDYEHMSSKYKTEIDDLIKKMDKFKRKRN